MELTEENKMAMMYAAMVLNAKLAGASFERMERWVEIVIDEAKNEWIWTSMKDALADFYERNPNLDGGMP
jgi:hypothetical protein